MTVTRAVAAHIDDLLTQGFRDCDVIRLSGAPKSYVRFRRKRMRANEALGGSLDSSCPRFAKNAEFEALVAAHGGLPRAVVQEDRTVWLGPDGHVWREVRQGRAA